MDECCGGKANAIAALNRRGRRRVLLIVLAINVVMFAVEFAAGWAARSSALMADSVDMLGDAFVYALSLYALDRSESWKAGAAVAKGGVMLILGLGIAVEVVDKIIHGVVPTSSLMAGFGALALAANLTCLALLWRHRDVDVNMSSTFECSRNDVIANLGVLVAAAGVWLTGQAWPDVLAGAVVAALFLRSSARVIASSWPVFGRLRTSPAVRDVARWGWPVHSNYERKDMTAKDNDGSAFWRQHARRYDRATNVLNRRFNRMVELVIQDVRGRARVLEVAAGTGLVTVELARAVSTVIATDQSPEMLAALKSRLEANAALNVEVRAADATRLEFADGSFDTVVAANVLHLLPQPGLALAEFHRVLQPDGVLCVPTFGHGQTMLAHLTSRVLALGRFPIVTRFDESTLRMLVENHGFAVVRSSVVPGMLPLIHVTARRI